MSQGAQQGLGAGQGRDVFAHSANMDGGKDSLVLLHGPLEPDCQTLHSDTVTCEMSVAW